MPTNALSALAAALNRITKPIRYSRETLRALIGARQAGDDAPDFAIEDALRENDHPLGEETADLARLRGDPICAVAAGHLVAPEFTHALLRHPARDHAQEGPGAYTARYVHPDSGRVIPATRLGPDSTLIVFPHRESPLDRLLVSWQHPELGMLQSVFHPAELHAIAGTLPPSRQDALRRWLTRYIPEAAQERISPQRLARVRRAGVHPDLADTFVGRTLYHLQGDPDPKVRALSELALADGPRPQLFNALA